MRRDSSAVDNLITPLATRSDKSGSNGQNTGADLKSGLGLEFCVADEDLCDNVMAQQHIERANDYLF